MSEELNFKKRDFVFIRHGQSEGNALGLCQGKADLELTELGRQQAFTAANNLKKYKGISRIFSSDLKRAYETAKIIALHLDCPLIERDAGLQERGWGILEGKPNEAMHRLELMESSSDFRESSKIIGLEEKKGFNLRAFNAVNQILHRTDIDTPLIVSHGRFFYALCDLMKVKRLSKIPNATPIHCRSLEYGWELSCIS